MTEEITTDIEVFRDVILQQQRLIENLINNQTNMQMTMLPMMTQLIKQEQELKNKL